MKHCPSCDYPLPSDRERLGARCPNCRDPLYEPPGRVSRPVRQGEGACALHAGREAVGTCGRCGNYFCEVCRTRWRDRILCAACVDRALAARQAAPAQVRAHFRQALLGLLLGLGAWPLFILALTIAIFMQVSHNVLLGLVVLALMVFAVLLAVMGTGQAAAALRTRGQHMIMAAGGLILGALFLGVFIGNYLFELWIL